MGWKANAARRAWLGYWNVMRQYHRYQVVGLDNLLRCRPALIVGYHGRPIAHDLCLLQAMLAAREGRHPRAIMHRAATSIPVFRHLVEGMDFLLDDGPEMAAAVANGDHIIVTPGGTREGCRSRRYRHQVDWGSRLGYLRLAARYRLPIVPTAAHGVDDTYIGLNDGYAWGKRLGAPAGLPLWLGIGPVGLWPISPPFPVSITTFVGAPMTVDAAPDDRDALSVAHSRVTAAVQRLLDDGARAVQPPQPRPARRRPTMNGVAATLPHVGAPPAAEGPLPL